MKKYILALVLVFAFGFVGCQKTSPPATPSKTDTKSETKINNTDNEKTDDEKVEANISLADAIKVFTDKYPEASIEQISFDADNQVKKYEIEAFDKSNEYEIEISAKDGSIIKDKFEKDNTLNKKSIDTGLISKVDALIEAALKDAGQGYKLDSYSIDYGESGAYNELDIEVRDSNGKDKEYKYNLETSKLIEKYQ